jgi:hypothetical protein
VPIADPKAKDSPAASSPNKHGFARIEAGLQAGLFISHY